MNSKAAILATVSLLAIAPFTLCSCGDKPPTTEGSAGTPAGWTGKKVNMNAGQPGAAAPSQPGGQAGGTKP